MRTSVIFTNLSQTGRHRSDSSDSDDSGLYVGGSWAVSHSLSFTDSSAENSDMDGSGSGSDSDSDKSDSDTGSSPSEASEASSHTEINSDDDSSVPTSPVTESD